MIAVMTLSSFHAAPCMGHLKEAKRIYGYISKMHSTTICVQTEEPDYSDLLVPKFNWL